MFCTKCGAQNPDTSAFCDQCGNPLTSPPAPPPVDLSKPGEGQPVQPVYSQQPQVFEQQPQPFGQQPQQFGQPPFGQQPVYAAPVYSQPGAGQKSKAVPIVIGIIAAAVVAFIVILFAVIIPGSGVKGKLRHRWSISEGGMTVTYDFKENTIETFGIPFPMTWDVVGDDRISIEMSLFGESQKEEFIFSISDDGKTLTLKDPDNPYDSMTLTRS